MKASNPWENKKFSPDEAMSLAISLAWQGWGKVSLNPMVGCVVLDREGVCRGAGFHQIFGGPHAEVNALQGLKPEDLRGGKIYVTLEPCSHYGKTPPCCDLVASYPFAELVVGARDPNPEVSGRGIAKISEMGTSVRLYQGALEKDLAYLNEIFFHNMNQREAFWAAKLASSIDGLIALSTGESKWITGEKAREEVHRLRAGFTATAVGSKTLRMDNPRLNVRHYQFPQWENKVLVFDSSAECLDDTELNLLREHKLENLIWISQGEHLKEKSHPTGIKIIQVDWTLENAFRELSEYLYNKEKISSILVEGGAQLISALVQKNILNRFYHFQAPILLGRAGVGMTEHLQLSSMTMKRELELIERESFGSDLLSVYRF